MIEQSYRSKHIDIGLSPNNPAIAAMKDAMSIDYPTVLKLKTEAVPYSWSNREVMLYALGIGMGADPLNERELQFVNEAFAKPKPLKVVRTFASVYVWGARPGVINLNRVMLVDGERDITFHKPMPVAAQRYRGHACTTRAKRKAR
ncbi:hypothetical protein [Bradyrhizobium sp. USDA 4513]